MNRCYRSAFSATAAENDYVEAVKMADIGVQEKAGLTFPATAEDSHYFDNDEYRIRMSKILDPANE